MQYKDKNGVIHENVLIKGESAFESAQIGGYKGTEEEFYQDLGKMATTDDIDATKEELDDKISQQSKEIEDYKLNQTLSIDDKTVIGGFFSANGEYNPDDALHCVSDFLDISKIISLEIDNTNMKFNRIGYWDENKNYISRTEISVKKITLSEFNKPANAKYIKVIVCYDDDSIIITEPAFLKIKGLMTSITIEKKIEDVNRNQTTTSDEILRNKIAISDTDMTCASASEVVVDEEKGFGYVVYLSSDNGYGEQQKYVKLTKFSIANPNDREHFTIREYGYEPNVLKLDDTLIITYLVGDDYKCKRFDIATKQIGSEEVMYISYGGSNYVMNKTNLIAYMDSKNATYGTYFVFTCKHIQHNGEWYSTITTDSGSPILCKSVDGITWELVNIISGVCQYETQIAFVDNVLYAINRSDVKTYKSLDLGQTWLEHKNVKPFYTRPQLLNYKNMLLEVIPDNANREGDLLNGRCTAHIILDNDNKITFHSKYGFVYPNIFTIQDDLYIVYSSGLLFNNVAPNKQGKDTLYLIRLGEMFKDKEYKINY